ncbi:MAG: hypothetical protein ACRCV5_20335 [Afipia sp.]
MIAQVGQMLDRIQHGQRLGNGYSVTTSDDHTIVLASAVLAVAAELRAIDNHLADLLDATRQPARMPASNPDSILWKSVEEAAEILAATADEDGAA